MARYTVHVPTGDALPREAALERAVFVRDGWSWGAFAFGPLWLFWHRHWVSGLIGLILFGGILGGISALPVAPWAFRKTAAASGWPFWTCAWAKRPNEPRK